MDVDPLDELRAVLRSPDQRTWHRRLGARLERPPEPAAPIPLLEQLGVAGDELRDAGPPGRRPPWIAIAVVPVLAVTIVAGTALRGRPSPDPVHDLAPVTTSEAPTTTAPSVHGEGEVAVRLWPTAPVEVVGREVRRGDERWAVGDVGDVVVVGDWDCDRVPTPAVLRPSTGTVAVFDTWGTGAAARTVTTVVGAASVRPRSRCGEAAVVGPDGTTQQVDTRPRTGTAAP